MSRKNKELKAVFFDLDRTLFDQKTAFKKGLIKTTERYSHFFNGIDKDRVVEEFFKAGEVASKKFSSGEPIDKARKTRSKILMRNLGLEESIASEFTESLMDIHTRTYAPMDGAKSSLENLSKVYPLGLITNGDRKNQIRKLETLGLKKYFQKLTFSEEIGVRKPDQKIFMEALDSMGQNSEDSIYIGDSYRADICGASKVGMKTCWLNLDGKDPKKRDIKPDFEVRSIREISDILIS